MALEVRQRSAHADEVIHQHVFAARRHLALEFGLPRQPPKAISAGVATTLV
jgi:hypothetical protein